jgi:hypothetical protein
MSVQTVQFLREVGGEFFKISNNVDVFLITNSTESSFSFTFRRGACRGKRKVYSLYTHENVDNCE